MKAILVSRFEPNPVGHGGNHRTYQILHDLRQALGPDSVIHVSLPQWQQSQPMGQASRRTSNQDSFWRKARHMGRRITLLRTAHLVWRNSAFLFRDHPTPSLADSMSDKRRCALAEFVGHYERIVQGIRGPAVCVIEHARFASLLPVNCRHGIPTISCVQNIESFDTATPLSYEQKEQAYTAVMNFLKELRMLSLCDERLFISKVEAGLVGGLGLSSHYYPYLPVGEIRRNLERVQQKRAKEHAVSGLFLMLGSGGHTTTWESFSWFVQNAQKHGLPTGVRVVVGGSQTDQLLPPGISVPGLELKGWLQQDELDDLLVHAQAVLAPQTIGFGALTRLPELSYAGIPVLVSRHPSYALDPPPNVVVVADSWSAWYSTIKKVANTAVRPDSGDYDAWERRQVNSLKAVVNRLLSDLRQKRS